MVESFEDGVILNVLKTLLDVSAFLNPVATTTTASSRELILKFAD